MSVRVLRLAAACLVVSSDKGFPEAIVTHELLPYPPGREHNAVRLLFTISEGKRVSRNERRQPAVRPADRCAG